jgi:hypothetical protein
MTALQSLRARARGELGVTLRRRPDGTYTLVRGPGAPGDLIARDADELRDVLSRWLGEPSPAQRRQEVADILASNPADLRAALRGWLGGAA